MSDIQRETLAVLAEVWGLSPDVRFGQLLAHLGFLGESHVDKGLGYIDDDEFLAILYRHRAELMARADGKHDPAFQTAGNDVSISGSPTLPDSKLSAQTTATVPR